MPNLLMHLSSVWLRVISEDNFIVIFIKPNLFAWITIFMRKENPLILSKNSGDAALQRLLSTFAIHVIKYFVTYVPFPAFTLECMKHGLKLW